MDKFGDSSIAIIEQDTSGETLIAWIYPGMSSLLQSVALKCCTSEGASSSFVYTKSKNDWIYCLSSPVNKLTSAVVTNVYICLSTRQFHPERYLSQLRLMQELYLTNKLDPTKVLEVYLTIHTTGDYGSYQGQSFTDAQAMLEVSSLMELSQSIGAAEFTILWNAMLLRKRVLVVSSDNVERLLLTVRSLPQLVVHRRDWSILRPLVRSDQESIEDLKTSGVYVAGTLDSSLISRTELYDVLLHLNDRKVTIAGHATDVMRMNAAHREVAQIVAELVEGSANGISTNRDLLDTVGRKTSQIISQLSSLGGEGTKLTEAVFQERISNDASRQWLMKVAVSEGLM